MRSTSPPPVLKKLDAKELERLGKSTVSHYEQNASAFWQGTRDHDVSQNIDAFLDRVGETAKALLDLGCGPGRDLRTFRERGHRPIGLDATPAFVTMAREYSGCEVWQQDLLSLDLPQNHFDGVFANAVLFHVPTQELVRVLSELRETLREDGVLFCSNPRGPNIETQQGLRYGCYLTLDTWTMFGEAAGFTLLDHYYRPPGRPVEKQPWLATVWRKR